MSDRDESAGFLKRWMLDRRVEDAWGKFVTSIEMPMSWSRLRFDAALAVFAQKASEVYAEQELAALTAENERLKAAMTEWAGMSGAVEIAISDLTNRSPWTALDVLRKARTFGDRARAALPSSRETTDG